MCICSVVKKTVASLIVVMSLTFIAVPVIATDTPPVTEDPSTEQAETLPNIPDTPEVIEPPKPEPDVTPNDEPPLEPNNEDKTVQANNSTQGTPEATTLELECLQDIRLCMVLLVYVIFPIIGAITLIKWFIYRPFSHFVSY